MAGNEASGKFFEALNDGYDAFIDAVRAANDRGHRASTALIEEAQRGQREAVDLAKQWAAAPLDVTGFYGSLVEATTSAQGRTLDATRQWFNEMTDAQQEARELIQRMVKANRSAGEAAVEAARGAFGRASEAAQSTARSVTATGGGDGRRTREPSRSSESQTKEEAEGQQP